MSTKYPLKVTKNSNQHLVDGSKFIIRRAWLIKNFLKLSCSIYKMKAHSLSFIVEQVVFQNNEKCSSYDVLNGHRYSKIMLFLGSHTSNDSETPLGHI